MNLLYLILPIALLIGAGFVVAFIWATRKGQFDDLETPAMRALFEDARRAEAAEDGTEKSA
ncbi:MAG: cbb3-type cytochrome oxidase assembly protein CcoS [Planctomycetes bacterium]|nr:cbb3-type cytochrome oxidase assembly protein CcoS [Planctomycetota bacterium]